MAIGLTLLLLLSLSALAGPFDLYQEQNNSGAEMTVLSTEFREYHAQEAEKNGRGHIEFSEPNCSKLKARPTCIAEYMLINSRQSTVVTGWMVFEMDDSGTIVAAAWVTSQPPMKIAYSAEKGQTADLVSTAFGLSMGATELNPLVGNALPVMAAVKLGTPAVLKRYASIATCIKVSNGFARIGYAAATFNASGFAIGPFAVIPAAVVYSKMTDVAPGFWRCIPDDIHPIHGVPHGD